MKTVFKTELRCPITIILCAALLSAFCSCETFWKDIEVEVRSEPENAGTQEINDGGK